jgi:regulatory protein
MIDSSSLSQARSRAIKYLSIREHASLELRNKLKHKGFEEKVIASVLSELKAKKLLSEERFAESYVRSRTQKGFGPLRIQQELRERGITGDVLTDALDSNDSTVIWVAHASHVRQKRFGSDLPKGQNELGKQVRFLQYRGFTPSQIKGAFLNESK